MSSNMRYHGARLEETGQAVAELTGGTRLPGRRLSRQEPRGTVRPKKGGPHNRQGDGHREHVKSASATGSEATPPFGASVLFFRVRVVASNLLEIVVVLLAVVDDSRIVELGVAFHFRQVAGGPLGLGASELGNGRLLP
jgi:hypothetical protein